MGTDWDKYFMNLVYNVAIKSKDESTHVGAVIVGPDHGIRSTGYNSFARGINDDLKERQERPEKYFWFSHSEVNAICNAAKGGISTDGCIMYTNGIPCMHCGNTIVQAGIAEVVYDMAWDRKNVPEWKEHAERTMCLFDEAGVQLRGIEVSLIGALRYMRGEYF